MNVTVQDWVDALRSGEYNQWQGQLRVNNSFCCLGVLADLEDSSCWKEGQWRGHGGILPRIETDLLPQAQQTFTTLNDTLQFSFSQIADFIEEVGVKSWEDFNELGQEVTDFTLPEGVSVIDIYMGEILVAKYTVLENYDSGEIKVTRE